MPEKPTSTLGALNQIVPSPCRLDESVADVPEERSIHTIIVLVDGTEFSEIVEVGSTQRASTFVGEPLPKGTTITSASGITDYTATEKVAAYFTD